MRAPVRAALCAALCLALLAPAARADSMPDVAERAVESVVNISTTRVVKTRPHGGFGPFFDDPFFRHFFDRRWHHGPGSERMIPKERRQQSLGSGVVVSKDGLILTNSHVVEHADEIRVSFSDTRELRAKVVGTDPKSDVAVLRLEPEEGDKLPKLKPLRFGDSSKLRLGETVLAVGNPFGLGHTVTMGIVSAKGRADVGIVDYEDFIQTDAAINPGNSGGALVNMRGELVGINTAIVSRSGGYQGIGFAIPVDMAKNVMENLLDDGKMSRGWLGVAIQNVDAKMAEALGLERGVRGALVSQVSPGSPAQVAGVEAGDVIVRVGDEEIDSSSKLRNVIAGMQKGTAAVITVVREGLSLPLTVVIGEQPSGDLEVACDSPHRLAGLKLEALDSGTRAQWKVPRSVDKGVVVTEVERGCRAAELGLRPGDVIVSVDKRPVDSVAAFEKAWSKAKGHVLIRLIRDGHGVFLAVRK